MKLRDVRERINLLIYDSKPKVLRILSLLNVLVSATAIGVLIFSYGFKITPETEANCFTFIECGFFLSATCQNQTFLYKSFLIVISQLSIVVLTS